ncbi:MAG TPA: right-handed parallel beta-helix repeat-containing protein [Micromonosporaceae bacterium]
MSRHRSLWHLLGLGGAALVGSALAVTIAPAMPAFAAATTLYVGGANCSDAGSGSQAQPFCTIGKAALVATAGQGVLVASGTYAERVAVSNSGTAANPIVFRPASGATVTVTGKANGFYVSGKSYLTIRGFRVTATTSNGIYLRNSHDLLIADNAVSGSGHPVSGQTAAGIELVGVTNSTVTGNDSSHNSDHGIYLDPGSSGNVISDNEATFNAESYRRNANGINVTGPSNSVIGNIVHDNEDSGLQFYPGGNNNLGALNVSYNNGDHGIDDLNVTGGRLIGNTVYHNCTSGINVEGTSGNYTIENNIAVDNAVYPAYNGIACNRRAGNIGIWDSAPATTTVDNNLVYLSRPGTMYVFGSSYASLAAMQTGTGQEAHGIQANPRFADAGAWDLQLTEGSAAIDAGNSGVTGEQSADRLGVARVDDPLVANTGRGPRAYDDLGAYEFVSSGTTRSPTARLSVTPSSGTTPLAVSADASASSDPQGQMLRYTFDFADGTTVGPQSSSTATHTFATAGTYAVKVTVVNTSQLTDSATSTVSVSDAVARPTFVGQIATNYSTTTHASGSITVWRPQGVAAGDMEVVTVALTGAPTTGAFSAVDDAGNALTVARDISGPNGARVAVLYGIAHHALTTNGKITVTFPGPAATYRVTGDELAGVSAVDKTAAATGTSSAYSSGSTSTTSTPAELVFGAVAFAGGSAPVWSGGWTAESSYTVSTNGLGRAYRITSATGSFAATGSISSSWLAMCVTFR